jgi:mono/diheme cytochrome c family protein
MTMKNTWMNSPRLVLACLMTVAGLGALPAQAVGHRAAVDDRLLQQECGSCHVVYPSQFLSADSWRAVMGGLDKHFGTDASLDPATRSEILGYLLAYAGKYQTSAGGKPLLRISETRWFVREHSEELTPAVWRNPAVKSPSNCSACHTAANQEDYSERTLHVPRGVKQ